jgi:hypothetical protein
MLRRLTLMAFLLSGCSLKHQVALPQVRTSDLFHRLFTIRPNIIFYNIGINFVAGAAINFL